MRVSVFGHGVVFKEPTVDVVSIELAKVNAEQDEAISVDFIYLSMQQILKIGARKA
jgi:hypothetical protein